VGSRGAAEFTLIEASPGYLANDLDAVMPRPHLDSSLLKRWTAGTLHHRIRRQHLPCYLDEFTFRFNRRTSRARGLLFCRLLQQAADTDPHPPQRALSLSLSL
jgi:ISXO2-like transposase domain